MPLETHGLELGGYFSTTATIEVRKPTIPDLFYSIDGHGQWIIVGKAKEKLDSGTKFTVEINAVPVKCGSIQIPQIRMCGLENETLEPEKHVVREEGNLQMVVVRPRKIVAACCGRASVPVSARGGVHISQI